MRSLPKHIMFLGERMGTETFSDTATVYACNDLRVMVSVSEIEKLYEAKVYFDGVRFSNKKAVTLSAALRGAEDRAVGWMNRLGRVVGRRYFVKDASD